MPAHGNGVGSMRIRSKQCGSACLGCALSQPTTSSPSKARKPSIAPTSMRAFIAMRFCVGRQRRPVDGARHVVEVAIALGPFRIVRERRAALVIEEAQEVRAERGYEEA